MSGWAGTLAVAFHHFTSYEFHNSLPFEMAWCLPALVPYVQGHDQPNTYPTTP